LEQLKKGGGLVIFPEGGRTRTGDILPFKPGFVRLALDTGACIVPVTIIGAYRAFSPWHKFPRPRKVKVIYHDPIRLEDLADQDKLKQYMKSSVIGCGRLWPLHCRRRAAEWDEAMRRKGEGSEVGHVSHGVEAGSWRMCRMRIRTAVVMRLLRIPKGCKKVARSGAAPGTSG
jgi:hypothetical protein